MEFSTELNTIVSKIKHLNIRIGGSFVTENNIDSDFDIFCEKSDFAELLFHSKKTKIHPSIVPDINNLHNRLTFHNSFLIDGNGNEYKSDKFVNSSGLIFNEKSILQWGQKAANNLLNKMLKRGFNISDYEKARFDVCINQKLDNFFDPEILELIKNKGDSVIIAGGVLRDLVLGKRNKDIDIFVSDIAVFNMLALEVSHKYKLLGNFERVDARIVKFIKDEKEYDLVYYRFGNKYSHLVDTFDYTVNMLWFNPNTNKILGPSFLPVNPILIHINEKKLVLGPFFSFNISVKRTLHRWVKFNKQGFKADDSTLDKIKDIITLQLSNKK
jgi:hypothetical protein